VRVPVLFAWFENQVYGKSGISNDCVVTIAPNPRSMVCRVSGRLNKRTMMAIRNGASGSLVLPVQATPFESRACRTSPH
jgi:hypothetical protein